MKVFISWSGNYSREVAEKLSMWIPSVIQSVDTFFSPVDIGKGENWDNVLSKELNDCDFGIICLTPENVAAPWIHFEAGALAKTLNSRLSSVMLGINTSDVKGPLSRFQNTKFERNDFFKLLQAINTASDKPLKSENLAYLFDTLWERWAKEIEPIMKKYENTSVTPQALPKTNDSDAIQEILSIVRKMSNCTIADKDIEYPHAVPNKTASEPVKSLHLVLTKRDPLQPLSDESNQILSRYLPKPISVQAISSLEESGEFFCFLPITQFMLQIIKYDLSKMPDVIVKASILM